MIPPPRSQPPAGRNLRSSPVRAGARGGAGVRRLARRLSLLLTAWGVAHGGVSSLAHAAPPPPSSTAASPAPQLITLYGDTATLSATSSELLIAPRAALLAVAAPASPRSDSRAFTLVVSDNGESQPSLTLLASLSGTPITEVARAFWQVDVRPVRVSGSAAPLHVFFGRGRPPAQLAWDGLDAHQAQLLRPGSLLEFRLTVLDGLGERLESAPVRVQVALRGGPAPALPIAPPQAYWQGTELPVRSDGRFITAFPESSLNAPWALTLVAPDGARRTITRHLFAPDALAWPAGPTVPLPPDPLSTFGNDALQSLLGPQADLGPSP